MRKPPMSRAARALAVLAAIGAALDTEDVIVIMGFVFLAIGAALVFSMGAALIVCGALLLYVGLWHRTLISWAIK